MGVLDGKVAIVTGAGRGIGASIARAYAQAGASLVLNDLGGATDGTGADTGPVNEVAEELRGLGVEVISDGGDISDIETGQRLVDTAVEKLGRLDIVVNSAGILRDRMIFNLSEQDWDDVIRVHLRGHYSTVRPASAYFRSQRNAEGHYRIINMSSMSGLQGSPGQPNYSAAKLGIVGLTYSLAHGLAKYGVTANAIAPSAATRMLNTIPTDKQIRKADPNSAERSPDNVATVAVFLGSDASDWLSGRTLAVGGFDVSLYNVPEPIRQVTSNGPWSIEQLTEQLEKAFRPAADGLAANIFSAQRSS